MGWGVFTYIFGAICIGGPLVVAFWYAKAARRKFREFAASAEARGEGQEER
jgi:hypothetical protein